ncbi:hypothetical protein CHRYSEO8AT_150083 [Chryseobacterium sp. 8AT]|nr:hypothetical protein CHRYSEO8AT_150083 [Chryseobacterium sp. 8AT]
MEFENTIFITKNKDVLIVNSDEDKIIIFQSRINNYIAIIQHNEQKIYETEYFLYTQLSIKPN